MPVASKYTITTNRKTSNEPLETLTDGKLADNFGPVFGNGILDGLYKLDLGSVEPITAINSYSFNKGGKRGAQNVTIFASDLAKDPGWDLKKLTPIGTIRTGEATTNYTAASLKAASAKTIGNYRWIIWATTPIGDAGGGENTAFQELSVETTEDVSRKGEIRMTK